MPIDLSDWLPLIAALITGSGIGSVATALKLRRDARRDDLAGMSKVLSEVMSNLSLALERLSHTDSELRKVRDEHLECQKDIGRLQIRVSELERITNT